MNNLIPIVASNRPMTFLGRLFLLLALIFFIGLLFFETANFIQLFNVDLVATPELPNMMTIQ